MIHTCLRKGVMIPISGSVTRGSNDVSSISWYTWVRTIFFFFFFVFFCLRERRETRGGESTAEIQLWITVISITSKYSQSSFRYIHLMHIPRTRLYTSSALATPLLSPPLPSSHLLSPPLTPFYPLSPPLTSSRLT